VNISLDLPSELENELSKEASHLKLPLAEYILRKVGSFKEPERVALTEAFLLLVNALAEINQASFKRRED
jgi:hypothetical protein